MDTVKILIADDHPLTRKGIKEMLSAVPGFAVVAETDDGARAMELIEKLCPDVAILDIVMPGLEGIELARRVQETRPKTKVIVLSMHEGHKYVMEAFRAGASGYALKGSDPEEIIVAVKAVTSGKRFVSPGVADGLISDYISAKENKASSGPLSNLSPRETEVLALIAEGLSNPQIAKKLFVSLSTIKKHKYNIMEKLNCPNVAGLVRLAIESGLVKNA